MQELGFIGKGRHKQFHLVKYEGKYYARSDWGTDMPDEHAYPHIIQTYTFGKEALWEYGFYPQWERDDAFKLDRSIRITIQLIQSCFELTEAGIQPEEIQWVLAPYDRFRLKRIDLTSGRYRGDIAEENVYAAYNHIPSEIRTWMNEPFRPLVSLQEALDFIHRLTLKIFERYKDFQDASFRTIPKPDPSCDTYRLVGTVTKALETYVFPSQKEINTLFQAEFEASIEHITRKKMRFE
jgi:hypothetical protein